MSTPKFLSVPLLMLAAGTFFTSCKKDDAPVQNCNIITLTPSSGNKSNFTYNADGRVASYTSGNQAVVYAYSGNTVIAYETFNGSFNSKKIITTGANGLATNVKTETNQAGTTWYNDAYEYSGKQLIKQTVTTSQNAAPSVTTIQWNGGNITSIATENGSASTLEYYTDKKSQKGDYMGLVEMVQGYRLYETKNIIKSMLTNGQITSFEYSYDNSQITSLKVTSGQDVTTYNFQYQCN